MSARPNLSKLILNSYCIVTKGRLLKRIPRNVTVTRCQMVLTRKRKEMCMSTKNSDGVPELFMK